MADRAHTHNYVVMQSWVTGFGVVCEQRSRGSLIRISRFNSGAGLRTALGDRRCVVGPVGNPADHHRAFVLVEWWPHEADADRAAVLHFEGVVGRLRLACSGEALVVGFDDMLHVLNADLQEVSRSDFFAGIGDFVIDRSGRILACGELHVSVIGRAGETLVQWNAPDVITGWNIGDDHVVVHLFDGRTERVELPDAADH